MSIDSFEIISVPVSDPQRAKLFYRDVLGFTLIREEPMGPEMTWIQLAPYGQSVTIALVTWFEKMVPGGLQGVMVNTQDIDADHALLKKRGVEIGDINQQAWGRFAMFNDPDGNGWILRQPPAGA
jgi:catechol 2,3-dioxygenase-like lactoylglutathione lyase family enzyme